MDGDPTGTVDINDLAIVLGTSAAAGIVPVPEPSGTALLLAGAGALLGLTWRKRRA